MIRLRPSRGEWRVFLRWKEVPIHVPNMQWGQTYWKVGDWSRERFIARPWKETQFFVPEKVLSSPTCVSRSAVSDSLGPHGLWPTRPLCPWVPPGKNTEVGYHSLSRGSSWPRDRTKVSCIAHRFFTVWATKSSPKGFGKALLKSSGGCGSQGLWSACVQFSDWLMMRWEVGVTGFNVITP